MGELPKAWRSDGEHYREVASKLHELAHQCHFPVARRELLSLAKRYELRAEHIDSRLFPGASNQIHGAPDHKFYDVWQGQMVYMPNGGLRDFETEQEAQAFLVDDADRLLPEFNT